MTVETAQPMKPKFGVGQRIGETFSIFGSRFGIFALIGVIWGLISQIPTFLALGQIPTTFDAFDQTAASPMQNMVVEQPALYFIAFFFLPVIIFAIMTGMLTLAAYDAKTGRQAKLGSYLGATLKQLVWLIVLTFLVYLMVTVGLILLVVPGVWVFGVFSVFVPIIMIEKLGFSSLGRSKRLTKEYRWPLIGFLGLTYVIVFAASLAVGVVGAFISPLVFFLLQGAVAGFTTAIFSIAMAVAYARLREIKDGVGFDDLAEVFA